MEKIPQVTNSSKKTFFFKYIYINVYMISVVDVNSIYKYFGSSASRHMTELNFLCTLEFWHGHTTNFGQ